MNGDSDRICPDDLLVAILGDSRRARGPAGQHQGATAVTTAQPQAPAYEGVVDLQRYPIRDPASPGYRARVQGCRDQLRAHGMAQLAGFLTPAAVTEMISVAGRLASRAW